MVEMKRMNDMVEVQLNSKGSFRSRAKSNNDNLDNSYGQNMMKNGCQERDEESEEDQEAEDLYDNVHPMIDNSHTGYKAIEDQNLLFKIISNTDIAVLDATLKRLNFTLDLTDIVNNDNGYSLLHLAVFKDSDHIVYSL